MRIVFLGLSTLLIVSSLFAQTTFSGHVRKLSDKAVVIGASVYLSTGGGGTTDYQGKFEFISDVNDNSTLIVAAYGYDTLFMKTSELSSFQDLSLFLIESTNKIEEVRVIGIGEGQIAAFIDMQDADNIKNIVAEEQILSFPDLNAAEVLQRVPGITLQRDQGEGRYIQLRGTPPQFTNFTINGEQVSSPEGNYRFVGMDIIPSDQINRIEVVKVLTPDMDGDAIGGAVNVITKTANLGAPKLSFAMASGYSNLRQAPIYNFQFGYGYTYKKIGFQISASYYQNNQGSDNIEYKFIKGPFFNSGSQGQGSDNYHLHYREAQLRYYTIQRTRISISPSITFKLDSNTSFYINAMFNRFSDDEDRRRKIYDLEDPLNESYFLYGGIKHDVKNRVKNQDLYTASFGFNHEKGNWEIDAQIFHSFAQEIEPNRVESAFENQGQAITIKFEDMDTDYPRATFPNEQNSVDAFDYGNYEFDGMLMESSLTREFLWTPRFNVKYNYLNKKQNKGYVKFGAKLRAREKMRDVRSAAFGAYRVTSNLYPGMGDTLNLARAADAFYEDNLLGQSYNLSYMPSAENLMDFYEFFPQFFIIDRNETRKNSYNSDYTYKENIYAGYGMFRHEYKRLMVLGGLRFERTAVLDNSGTAVILDGNKFIGLDTISHSRVQDFILPQLQLKYALNAKMNLRAAITYTYSRPNYSDLIPSREEDRNEVSIGNPDLNYPRSTNIDLMLERYYLRSIFSAGVFYKGIQDFVFSYKRFGREGAAGTGNYPIFEFTKPLNGKDAFVLGCELQAQTKFHFLPGFLSNLGIYSNYTYTHSRAFIPKRLPANYSEAAIINPIEDDLSQFFSEENQEPIELPGQAKHAANIGFFYDYKWFFARLTANYQDDFLVEIGPDPDFDVYYNAAWRLDFTTNIQCTKKLNAFVDFINITDTPLKYYMGDKSNVQKLEYYSWWCRGGIRVNL